MPNTLTIQHLIDGIPDDGWLCNASRETFCNRATELLDEGWTIERVSEFLSDVYTAVSEEIS